MAVSPVAHVTLPDRPVGSLRPIRCRRVSRVCPAERGLLGWSQAAGVATPRTHLSDSLVILIMKVPLLRRPQARAGLTGSRQCQVILGRTPLQTDEGARAAGGRLGFGAEYPCPQGPVWDSIKDALLSLIKYASLPVKL